MRGRRAPGKTEAGERRQAPAWQSFKLSHRQEWDVEGPQPAGGTNTNSSLLFPLTIALLLF